MKFASTTRVVVYYNPHTRKFGRSSHVYFDELNVGTKSPHKPQYGDELIKQYPHLPDSTQYKTSTCHIQNTPILSHPITTYKIILPDKHDSCNIKFYDDKDYGIPYIKSIQPTSFIGKQLPQPSLTQQYLISIENEEPIHTTSAAEEFSCLRRTHAKTIITLQLSKRDQPKPTNYEKLRTKFDQLRPVIATNADCPSSIKQTHTSIPRDLQTVPLQHIPTVAILTHSAVKPVIHKNIMDCFKPNNPHNAQWKYTVFQQYNKNASYRVFTKPQPIRTLPPNIDILKSVLAPTVKPTESKNLRTLGLRYCVNGKSIKGDDKYGPTFAPTIAPETLRFQLAYSAAFNFQLQTIDCSNAFQCTYEPDPSKQIWCYLPPFYIQ